MSRSSIINALFRLKRSGNKTMALWDAAEPISLDEFRAKLAALPRNDLACKPAQPGEKHDAIALDELWKIFESLEDLEDCLVI